MQNAAIQIFVPHLWCTHVSFADALHHYSIAYFDSWNPQGQVSLVHQAIGRHYISLKGIEYNSRLYD